MEGMSDSLAGLGFSGGAAFVADAVVFNSDCGDRKTGDAEMAEAGFFFGFEDITDAATNAATHMAVGIDVAVIAAHSPGRIQLEHFARFRQEV